MTSVAALTPAGRATRESIADAARRLFAERGFDGASVRAIAAAAGIDPSLVIRHFGSKEGLYLCTEDTTLGISTVLEGPIESAGRRLVSYLFGPEQPALRRRYVALAQAAHRDGVREELVRRSAEECVAPLAARLSGPDAELRASLALGQLAGLLNLLFLQRTPAVVDADPDTVIARYGDAVQRLLTPEG
jgi:AcrR family transcriptional regulator